LKTRRKRIFTRIREESSLPEPSIKMDKIDQGSFRGLQAELSMMNAVYLLEEAKADKPEPTIVDCSHGFSTKDTAE
jgi:hypothetical protein